MRAWIGSLVALVATWLAVAPCRGSDTPLHFVTRVVAHGAARTRISTLEALLPRPPPAHYTAAEIEDFDRRLNNLAIFDSARAACEGDTLQVHVREKWTLIPDFAMATGKTPSDLFLAAGVTEYNLFGLATELAVSGYREQRGFGFSVGFAEHEYRQQRWGYGAQLSYGSAGSRFDDGREWFTTGAIFTAWTNSRPVLSPYFRYQVSLTYQLEQIEDVIGDYRPPNGSAVQLGLGLTYDDYRWGDLNARGTKVSLIFGPGVFLPAGQQRHFAELIALFAYPLARYTMLGAKLAAALSSRGNANASYLIGSIEGVRGLDDSLYRSWAQSSLNLELRQAIPLFPRLALQLVAFNDLAAFQRLDAFGRRAESVLATSVGGGVRVVPTFLAQFLFRFDLAYLLAPDRLWFPQLGIAQYF